MRRFKTQEEALQWDPDVVAGGDVWSRACVNCFLAHLVCDLAVVCGSRCYPGKKITPLLGWAHHLSYAAPCLHLLHFLGRLAAEAERRLQDMGSRGGRTLTLKVMRRKPDAKDPPQVPEPRCRAPCHVRRAPAPKPPSLTPIAILNA